MYTLFPQPSTSSEEPGFLTGDFSAVGQIHAARYSDRVVVGVIRHDGTTTRKSYSLDLASSLLRAIEYRLREVKQSLDTLIGTDASLEDLRVWVRCLQSAIEATPERIAELRAAQPEASDELTPAPSADMSTTEPVVTAPETDLAIA